MAVLGIAVALATAAAQPSPAGGLSYPSDCPIMTDSITRLYYAYLGREPDRDGFDQWVGLYRTGAASLEEISDQMASTQEFEARGLTTDVAFVDWAYQHLFFRTPSEAERRYWITALGDGYPRGSMMLALTETYDYVTETSTKVPLAGYLRWYPRTTHWYCGRGPATVPVTPLIGDVRADFYLHNSGDEIDVINLSTAHVIGQPDVVMSSGALQPGFTEYDWDGVFRGSGDYGQYIEVEAGDETEWIVVFYPRSIGIGRLGWELTPGS